MTFTSLSLSDGVGTIVFDRYLRRSVTSKSWQAFHWHCSTSYWCFLESMYLFSWDWCWYTSSNTHLYIFLLPNWSLANLATFSFCCVFFWQSPKYPTWVNFLPCHLNFFLLMANFWGSPYLKLEDEESESFLEDTWLPFLPFRGGGIDKRSPYTNAVNPPSTLLPLPNNVHFLDALSSLYSQWIHAR